MPRVFSFVTVVPFVFEMGFPLKTVEPENKNTASHAECSVQFLPSAYFSSVTMKSSKVTFAPEFCSSLQANKPTAPLV